MRKKLIYSVILSIILFAGCKKDEVEPYAFPNLININNVDCLQSWQDIEFQVSNQGSKVNKYEVYGWFGDKEESIKVDLKKYDYASGGNGFKFLIPQKDVTNDSVIFIQLVGYADKGYFGTSDIYKFKKQESNGCIKWIGL
jgi:hypothetical protein